MVPVLVKIYKLIINDLRNQLMNKADEQQLDDDEDEVKQRHFRRSDVELHVLRHVFRTRVGRTKMATVSWT